MTVIGYTRLSQDSDTSIAAQEEVIRAYCDRHGHKLADVYDEGEGVSGFETERPVLDDVLDRLESEPEVDGLVVRDRARLSRDRFHRLELVMRFRECGWELHIAQSDEVVDLDSDPYSLVVEAVQATADDIAKRAEIEKSREETRRRQEQGCHQGRPLFGTRYGPDNCHLVPDRDSGEWDVAMRVLRLKYADVSQMEAVRRVDGVSRSQVRSIWSREQRYIEIGKRGSE